MRSLISDKEFAYLVSEEPLISYLLSRTNIISKRDMPFCAMISTKEKVINLYLNDDKFLPLTTQQKLGVIVHEYLHILLGHCSGRLNGQEYGGSGFISKRMNIAMDLAINSRINNIYELPRNVYLPSKLGLNEGLSAEEYYRLIDDDLEGDDLDSHDHFGDFTSSDLADILGEFSAGENGYGSSLDKNTSVALNRLLGRGSVEWKRPVLSFIKEVVAGTRRSSKRWSRRYGAPISGRRRFIKKSVAVVVDTSASMCKDNIKNFLVELKNLSDKVIFDIILCDNMLQGRILDIGKIEEIDFSQGGTDLQPAFDLLQDTVHTAILCYTDGYFKKEISTRKPTLWLIENNNNFTPSSGKVVNIDTKEY